MPDISLESFRTMVAVLKRVSVKTIDIIGGEPTLHPNIVDIIRSSVISGISVNISTNGSNLDILKKIAALGKQISIGISVNDFQTLRQVSKLIKTGGPVVKTVYTNDLNFRMIEAILSFKPKKFYLIYRDILKRAELDQTISFHKFYSTVEKLSVDSQIGMVFCSGFLPDIEHYPELATARCPAGSTKLGVLPDGSVYPCNLFFGEKDFLLGNILTDTFDRIWNNQALRYFRAPSKKACTLISCRLYSQCHGGCPAQSFLVTGNLDAPDPRCP